MKASLRAQVTRPLAELLAQLNAIDQRVDGSPCAGLSLDPRVPGRRATPLVVLLDQASDLDDDARLVLGGALAQVGESVLEAFPLNLFWDMDGVFAELRRVAASSLDDACGLADALARLMALFGRDSPIRFQYVHDFIYGFDWAEWVRREPRGRAAVRPFDARYVARTWQRGQELLDLIAADDSKYPPVPPDTFRNPFSFTRTPEEERRLFESLAAAEVIPNPAWRQDAPPRWDRDFDAEREAIAVRLGLAR